MHSQRPHSNHSEASQLNDVYIKHFPMDTRPEEIAQAFQAVGLDVIPDRVLIQGNYGFVTFESAHDAAEAIRQGEEHGVFVRESKIVVNKAFRQTQQRPNKSRNYSAHNGYSPYHHQNTNQRSMTDTTSTVNERSSDTTVTSSSDVRGTVASTHQRVAHNSNPQQQSQQQLLQQQQQQPQQQQQQIPQQQPHAGGVYYVLPSCQHQFWYPSSPMPPYVLVQTAPAPPPPPQQPPPPSITDVETMSYLFQMKNGPCDIIDLPANTIADPRQTRLMLTESPAPPPPLPPVQTMYAPLYCGQFPTAEGFGYIPAQMIPQQPNGHHQHHLLNGYSYNVCSSDYDNEYPRLMERPQSEVLC